MSEYHEVLARIANALETIADAVSWRGDEGDKTDRFPLERIADALEAQVSTDNLGREFFAGLIDRMKPQ